MNKKRCFQIGYVTGGIFLLLALIIRIGFTTKPFLLDTPLMNFAYHTRNGFWNFLYSSLSTIFGDVGGVVFALCLGLLLWFFFKERIGAVWLVLSAALSVIINTLIKLLIGRDRPDINRLAGFANESGKSFASGHSVFATVICGCILLIFIARMQTRNQRLLLIGVTLLITLLVMYARIYVGVHYPSDTVGGLLEGSTILTFTYPYFETAHRKEKNGYDITKIFQKK